MCCGEHNQIRVRYLSVCGGVWLHLPNSQHSHTRSVGLTFQLIFMRVSAECIYGERFKLFHGIEMLSGIYYVHAIFECAYVRLPPLLLLLKWYQYKKKKKIKKGRHLHRWAFFHILCFFLSLSRLPTHTHNRTSSINATLFSLVRYLRRWK